MTTIQLYRKHKAGEVSREKFLYEVRRDNNLPFITSLTSYDDAVKILKNKGIVTESDTKEAKADEAVKAEVKSKKPSEKKPDILHIDYANPYEYRHGLQYELEQGDDYSNEALEKAKTTVLKNLAKDVNFYSTLLNQKQSPYEFKSPETDAPGMQAKADGYLKKELKKDEKANVKDSLSKSEAAKGKPKGVKEMSDKGVEGKEKTIKEGVDDKVEDMIKSGKIKPEEVKAAAEKAMKGDVSSLMALMAGIKLAEDQIEEAKKSKYITVDEEGDYQLNSKAIEAYLKSVIDPEEIENVDIFMNDDEGYGESSSYFFDNDEDPATITDKEVEDWAKQELSYWLFSSPDEFPSKEMNEHHNDPNFPGGTKIHAMLDKVADEWGKDSDVYSDLEDAIVGWSNRNGELSPKGILAIKALLSNWDMLDDYEEFLGENVEEGSFMGGVDLGSSFEKMKGGINAEEEFETLMKKYDWYAEMSDDARKWDAQQAMKDELRKLSKNIGVAKAVEIFNRYAPSDRKVTSSDSMWGMSEDKHAKIKEALKKALKETDPQLQKLGKDEENAERNLAAILTKKAALLNKPGTQG